MKTLLQHKNVALQQLSLSLPWDAQPAQSGESIAIAIGNLSASPAARQRCYDDLKATIFIQAASTGALWGTLGALTTPNPGLKIAGGLAGLALGSGVGSIPASLIATRRVTPNFGTLLQSMINNFAAYGIFGEVMQARHAQTQSLELWTIGMGALGLGLSFGPYLATKFGDANPVTGRSLQNAVNSIGLGLIYGLTVLPNDTQGLYYLSPILMGIGAGVIGAIPDCINKCMVLHERNMTHYQSLVSNYFLTAIEFSLCMDGTARMVGSVLLGFAGPLINTMIGILEHCEVISQRTSQALSESMTNGLLKAILITLMLPDMPYLGAVGFVWGFTEAFMSRMGGGPTIPENSEPQLPPSTVNHPV